MSRALIGVVWGVVFANCGIGPSPARVRSGLGTDPAQFNFESDLQGWTRTGSKLHSLSPTQAPVFLGGQALRVNVAANNQSGGAQYISVVTNENLAGKTVTFHVYFPAGCPLASVQPFTDDAAPNPRHWNGAPFSGSAIAYNTWNELTVAVPAGAAPVRSIGLELVFSAAWTGAITVDSVGWRAPAEVIADAGAPDPGGPVSGELRVMLLGDSITEGVNGGYRNGLWDQLTGQACTVDYVGSLYDQYAYCPDKDHEGHPGYTIGALAAEVDGWLEANPNFVLLMIGTNDVAWWCATQPAQLAAEHDRLVGQILASEPGAWVLVASIPPLSSHQINPYGWDRATLAHDLNAEIQRYAEQRAAAGQRVRFVDVASALTVRDLYDGVHPTLVAHEKIASAWYKVIGPLLSCQ